MNLRATCRILTHPQFQGIYYTLQTRPIHQAPTCHTASPFATKAAHLPHSHLQSATVFPRGRLHSNCSVNKISTAKSQTSPIYHLSPQHIPPVYSQAHTYTSFKPPTSATQTSQNKPSTSPLAFPSQYQKTKHTPCKTHQSPHAPPPHPQPSAPPPQPDVRNP